MSATFKCPKCQRRLAEVAQSCMCGWSKGALPAAAYMPCSDDVNCRRPGRMWVEGMPDKDRVCVEHYYLRIDAARKSA